MTVPESGTAVHEPDEMGAWSEDDGTAWLPRTHYPTRSDAQAFYSKFIGVPWIEVSVLSRWARHAPDHPSARYFDGEFWVECDRDEAGAFPVWRCE